MTASPEAVAKVQEALGCQKDYAGALAWCRGHAAGVLPIWTDRGCEVAVAAADAAAPHVLRDTANAWTQHEWSNALLPPPSEGIIPLAYAQLMGDWLRARADRIEAS